MENAISTISILPENKSEIETFVNSFVDTAKNGDYDPLEVLKKIKILDELTTRIRKELSDFFQSEADNYPEKSIEYLGCIFQKRNVSKYDYSSCNDSEYDLICKQLEEVKKDKKKREEFLKNIQNDMVSMSTGEVINAPKKTIVSQIAVTIK